MASEWREGTLGDLVTLQRGHDLTEGDRKPGHIPVMGSAGPNGFHDTAVANGPGVVVGRSGASFGQVHHCKSDYWPHNTALYVKNFKGNDPLFVYYCLKNINFARYNSGSAQPSLNRNYIHPIPLVYPDVDQQRRIAHILGTFDDKIELNRRMNRTLEATAQAIFKSWFVDFEPVKAKVADKAAGATPEAMNRAAMAAIASKTEAELDQLPDSQQQSLAQTAALFPDTFQDSELGEIPEGWTVSTLGEHSVFQNGFAFKSKDWVAEGVPVVKIGSVKPGIVNLSGSSFVSPETVEGLNRFELESGDILVGMTGYLGETGVVPITEAKPFLNQRVGRISPPDNEPGNYAWIHAHVRNPAFKEYAESRSHGSAQANVSGKALMEFPLVFSGSNIVSKFSELTEPLIQKYLANDHESRTLAKLRDTLLPKLLSGSLSLTREPLG